MLPFPRGGGHAGWMVIHHAYSWIKPWISVAEDVQSLEFIRPESVTTGPSVLQQKPPPHLPLCHHCALPCLLPLNLQRFTLQRHLLQRSAVGETLSTYTQLQQKAEVSEGDNALLPCTALNRHPHGGTFIRPDRRQEYFLGCFSECRECAICM